MSENTIRVGARIGIHHNDYLDAESKRTGISKSTLIQLAIDNYMRQNQSMTTLEQLITEIRELKELQEENLNQEEK